MKRFLRSTLSIVLALTIILSPAAAGLGQVDFGRVGVFLKEIAPNFIIKSNAASESDLTFKLSSDGTYYSVTDCNTSAEGDLVIPGTYNNLPVTKIGDSAFEGCDSLVSVAIGNSVTSIGDSAFNGCNSLTSITIPDGLTSIGEYAFANSSLTNVNLPKGIINIGNGAFSATTIGNNTEIRENGALYIGEYLIEVFEPNDENYIIKDGTVLVAGGAFSWTFSSDIQVKSVKIPNSVKYIGDNAFSHCYLLDEVIVPDSVETIGDHAFYYCTNLNLVNIGKNVKHIGDYCFYGCDKIRELYINNNYVFSKAPISGTTEIVTLGNEVTIIPADSFSGCVQLSTILMGNNLTNIGERAFYDCTSLTSITIPDSIVSIGNWAFYNCDNLVSATIGNGVTSIGNSAFYDCDNLTSVVIGDSVTNMGDFAFDSCDKLNSVTIADGVTTIGNWAFSYCKNLISITIPNSVTNIGEYAFAYCDSLASIIIPDSVTSIGDYAFAYCDSLDSIIIPSSLIDIGSYTFYNVGYYNDESNWKNDVLYIGNHLIEAKKTICGVYEIKEGTKTVSPYAFYQCNNLTSVVIPNSVTSIGNSAFNSCNSLKFIFYNGTKLERNNVAIGSSNNVLENAIWHYEATDHISSDWVIAKEPTCTKVGSKQKVCTICDEVLETESIPATGHTNSDWIIDLAATCTADGSKHIECTVCDKKLETAVILATGHTSSDWIIDKSATVNAAGSKHKECTVCGEVLETESIPQLKPAAPKLTSVTNSAKGATVKWGAVEGADNYNVYRKTYNASTKKWSGWSRIEKGTTSTSFTDTTAKSGAYYRYTVIANNEAGSSKYDTTGLKIYFLSTPKLTCIANNTGKVTVKWGKVSGATGYFVYRRTYNATTKTWGGWTRIAKTKSNAYNDTSAKSGVYYRYTVRAYYGSYTSYFNTTGLQTKYLAIPTLKTVASYRAGVKVTWSKVSGASGYYVYRRTYSGGEWTGWKRIAKVSGGSKVSYLDESTKPGVYYKYTVRAYSGNYASWYNGTGLKIKAKY